MNYTYHKVAQTRSSNAVITMSFAAHHLIIVSALEEETLLQLEGDGIDNKYHGEFHTIQLLNNGEAKL